jgi:putative membrane protein
MDHSLSLYFLFFGICAVLWLVGLGLYALITPQREMKLIAAGNRAAAVSLSGTAIALAAVLCATAAVSTSVPDLLKMGGIGLVCQLAAFVLVALLLPSFRQGIADDKLSYGLLLAGISLGVALLNVGAMLSLTG